MADMHAGSTDDGLKVVANQLREARERHVRRLAVYKAAGYDRAACRRCARRSAIVPSRLSGRVPALTRTALGSYPAFDVPRLLQGPRPLALPGSPSIR
jgi:hypothetical protein